MCDTTTLMHLGNGLFLSSTRPSGIKIPSSARPSRASVTVSLDSESSGLEMVRCREVRLCTSSNELAF
ncbi:hypothetical protein BDY21DRAFT_345425 [Lineolata rhizophorae]|uniref:Uncharacterized protein n=1 Tax=Lineolata rhizophorae TaxID=578093 RepID=A0A6A6P0E6_9PEZI|nr:hypothetical protein BDY21DRAFT_345425 [Lineolata rhizophorae]